MASTRRMRMNTSIRPAQVLSQPHCAPTILRAAVSIHRFGRIPSNTDQSSWVPCQHPADAEYSVQQPPCHPVSGTKYSAGYTLLAIMFNKMKE
jgi:hypothetical protein